MDALEYQKTYWDAVAKKKTFTNPIQFDNFSKYVNRMSNILDYGCGYGRTCAELVKSGYPDVIGLDISPEMIKRGLAG